MEDLGLGKNLKTPELEMEDVGKNLKEVIYLLKNRSPISDYGLKSGITFCSEEISTILYCIAGLKVYQYLSEDLVDCLFQLLVEDGPYIKSVFEILVNVSSEEEALSSILLKTKESTSSECTVGLPVELVERTCREITNRDSFAADAACMMLSNLTRPVTHCEQVVTRLLQSGTNKLLDLVTAFTTIGYNKNGCNLDHLGLVFCNLCQLAPVRKHMLDKKHCLLQNLLPYIIHSGLGVRKQGIVGVVRNCSFATDAHEWLLNSAVDVLPCLLLPLAGPEEFDDEDTEKLPIELQYLPDTKTREPDPKIRKMLLETLNQLCATRYGREYLRSHNTYIILRELHKWERDRSVLLTCENVIDILIRTEAEIGKENLIDIEVPADLEVKFKKMDDDFLSEN